MLKQRIITALILLPVALGGFFLLNGGDFALFIGFVVTLGAWEWARLAGLMTQPLRIAYALVVAGALMLLYILPELAPWVLGAAVIWWGWPPGWCSRTRAVASCGPVPPVGC